MRDFREIEAPSLNGKGTLVAPDVVKCAWLRAGDVVDLVKPTGADFAVFSATGNFFVAYDTTVALPSNAFVDSGEINPKTRYVEHVTTMSFVAPISCFISVAFYVQRL